MYRLMPFTRRAMRAAAALAAMTASSAAAQAVCAAGETTVRPGDARLAAARPHEQTVEMWMERDTVTRPLGTFTQSVSRVRHEGADAWRVVQRSETPRGEIVDTVTIAAGTWAPLAHRVETPVYRAALAYHGAHVAGTFADSAGERRVDTHLDGSRFDYSVASLALSALTLCEGLIVRVFSYDASRGPVELVARVAGAERVTLKGRTHDVWTVEVDTGYGVPSRLYFDRATGREVGWSVTFPDGRSMKGASR